MLREVSLRSVLIVGLVRRVFSMFFLSVYHTIPRDKIFGLSEAVLTPDAFRAFTMVAFMINDVWFG